MKEPNAKRNTCWVFERVQIILIIITLNSFTFDFFERIPCSVGTFSSVSLQPSVKERSNLLFWSTFPDREWEQKEAADSIYGKFEDLARRYEWKTFKFRNKSIVKLIMNEKTGYEVIINIKSNQRQTSTQAHMMV